MKRDLIILCIGLAAGYILFHKRGSSSDKTITLGDKAKEIEGMQKIFEKVVPLRFDDYGVYDRQTSEASLYLLKGTSALKNDKGDINFDFARDLNTMYNNSKKV